MKKLLTGALAALIAVSSTAVAFAAEVTLEENGAPVGVASTVDEASPYELTAVTLSPVKFSEFKAYYDQKEKKTTYTFNGDFSAVSATMTIVDRQTGETKEDVKDDSEAVFFVFAETDKALTEDTDLEADVIVSSPKYGFSGVAVKATLPVKSDQATADSIKYAFVADNTPIELFAYGDFDYKFDKGTKVMWITLKNTDDVDVFLRNIKTGEVEQFNKGNTKSIVYALQFQTAASGDFEAVLDAVQNAKDPAELTALLLEKNNIIYKLGTITTTDNEKIEFGLPVKLNFPDNQIDYTRTEFLGYDTKASGDSATPESATKESASTGSDTNGAIATGAPLTSVVVLVVLIGATAAVYFFIRKRNEA